jgi:hypothetical protein
MLRASEVLMPLTDLPPLTRSEYGAARRLCRETVADLTVLRAHQRPGAATIAELQALVDALEEAISRYERTGQLRRLLRDRGKRGQQLNALLEEHRRRLSYLAEEGFGSAT